MGNFRGKESKKKNKTFSGVQDKLFRWNEPQKKKSFLVHLLGFEYKFLLLQSIFCIFLVIILIAFFCCSVVVYTQNL